MTPLGMRRLSWLLLVVSTTAAADRQGPAPEPLRVAKEQPCERTASKSGRLVGRYTCQLAIDGVWGQTVPCEIIEPPKPREYDGYLRFSKWLSCDIVGSVNGGAFDGSVWCNPAEPDQIGHEALIEGQLRAIAGGYRMDTVGEMIKTYAYGPGDVIPRKMRQQVTKLKFSLNVCRRAWPAGFTVPVERATGGKLVD